MPFLCHRENGLGFRNCLEDSRISLFRHLKIRDDHLEASDNKQEFLQLDPRNEHTEVIIT